MPHPMPQPNEEGKLTVNTTNEIEAASSLPGAWPDSPSSSAPSPMAKRAFDRAQSLGHPPSILHSWKFFETRRDSQPLEKLDLDSVISNVMEGRLSQAEGMSSRLSIGNPGMLVSLPQNFFDANRALSSQAKEDLRGISQELPTLPSSNDDLSSHLLSIRGMTREPVSPFPFPFMQVGGDVDQAIEPDPALAGKLEGERTLIKKDKVIAALAHQPTPPPLPPNFQRNLLKPGMSSSPEGTVKGGGFIRRGSFKIRKPQSSEASGIMQGMAPTSPNTNRRSEIGEEAGQTSVSHRLGQYSRRSTMDEGHSPHPPTTLAKVTSRLSINERRESFDLSETSPRGSAGDGSSRTPSLESQNSSPAILFAMLLDSEPLFSSVKGKILLKSLSPSSLIVSQEVRITCTYTNNYLFPISNPAISSRSFTPSVHLSRMSLETRQGSSTSTSAQSQATGWGESSVKALFVKSVLASII